MAQLDIELENDLIDGVRHLAARHYGDASDASIARVTEAALEMRLLWQDLVTAGGREIEEPVVDWEFGSRQSVDQLPTEITAWLFRRS